MGEIHAFKPVDKPDTPMPKVDQEIRCAVERPPVVHVDP
jgi:hypothetical protein